MTARSKAVPPLVSRRADIHGPGAAPPCSRADVDGPAGASGVSKRRASPVVGRPRLAKIDATAASPKAELSSAANRRRSKAALTHGATPPLPRCAVPAPGRLRLPADTETRLLSSLYDSVARPDGWASFIHDLAETYPGGHGALVVHDQALHNGMMQVGSHWEPNVYTDYNRYYVTKNPWIPHLIKRPVGQAMFPDVFVPRAELEATEFYCDLLRPVQIDTAIGVTLQRDGSRFMDVSVLVPMADAERDPDALERLQRLAPHLLRVAQLNRQLAGLELRGAAAEAALDRSQTAVLVVDGTGRVVHMNAAAERIVVSADGLAVSQGVLRTAGHNEMQALQRLVAEALRAPRDVASAPGGVMRISRRSGAAAYEVLVAPLAVGPLSAAGAPVAVMFVRDPATRSRTPVEWLRNLYGLTGAEARLMQGLLAGETLEQLGQQFAVSRETLRSQLKAVFAKTGTSSQIDLLRLGLRGLAAFRP